MSSSPPQLTPSSSSEAASFASDNTWPALTTLQAPNVLGTVGTGEVNFSASSGEQQQMCRLMELSQLLLQKQQCQLMEQRAIQNHLANSSSVAINAFGTDVFPELLEHHQFLQFPQRFASSYEQPEQQQQSPPLPPQLQPHGDDEDEDEVAQDDTLAIGDEQNELDGRESVEVPPIGQQQAKKQHMICAANLPRCTICQIEEAKVFHFGVSICTGCRAFFRRSIAQQKTYRCLNSRLCGNTNPVPSRRVCKFCRLQRCISAGMLKSKEAFQMQRLRREAPELAAQHANENGQPPLPHPNALTISAPHSSAGTDYGGGQPSSSAGNVLEHFLLCRRRIAYERLQHFYSGTNGATPCPGMDHAIALGWREAGLFNRTVFSALAPFNEFAESDSVPLFLDYAYCWTLTEHLWVTIRNGGHNSRRSYHLDGHYVQANEEGAQRFYGPTLLQVLKDPSPAVHQTVLNFFLACSLAFLRLAKEVARVGLDEEEATALALLIFTRHEALGMVSKKCAESLLELRKRTLKALAEHVHSVGRDVAERIGQIIFLLTPIQEHIRLNKSMSPLLRSACVESLLPSDYLKLVDEAEAHMDRLKIV